jgi:phosphoglycerate kinase
MIKFVEELKKEDLAGKKVLLRVDFNVPVEDGKIVDSFKVKANKETIDYLLGNGAKMLLISHIDIGDTFGPIVEELGEILNHTLTLVPHSELGAVDKLFGVGPLLLLDNIRQDPREEKNDDGFAAELAAGFDYYVNDAFAVCHRNHASVAAIIKHLPSYAGFLIRKETESLSKAIEAPSAGKVLVMGGAKISTKLPVIKNFLDKAERILIGGAIANNFFKANGVNVGYSVVDDTVSLDVKSDKILLSEDILISDDKTGKSGTEVSAVKDIEPEFLIVDIGPETAKKFAEIIAGSSMVVWNGPMGLSEVEEFAAGTNAVSVAVASAAVSIIGGGDTISAVGKLGLLDKMSFVSTGGGAMLEFLAGNKLPGLEALNYYD